MSKKGSGGAKQSQNFQWANDAKVSVEKLLIFLEQRQRDKQESLSLETNRLRRRRDGKIST